LVVDSATTAARGEIAVDLVLAGEDEGRRQAQRERSLRLEEDDGLSREWVHFAQWLVRPGGVREYGMSVHVGVGLVREPEVFCVDDLSSGKLRRYEVREVSVGETQRGEHFLVRGAREDHKKPIVLIDFGVSA